MSSLYATAANEAALMRAVALVNGAVSVGSGCSLVDAAAGSRVEVEGGWPAWRWDVSAAHAAALLNRRVLLPGSGRPLY